MNNKDKQSPSLLLRWTAGMIMSSVFSSVYFLGPFYMIASLVLILKEPTSPAVWLFISPLCISTILKPIPMPWLIQRLRPMILYFQYEEIHEKKPRNVSEEINQGKNFLLVCQPHGALSLCGICSAIDCPTRTLPPTAVADALLHTPILKHVLGIFGLVSASKQSMIRQLKKPGAEGTVVLYVGGMAELFLSCENEEKLYLKKRKGFIKLALTTGVDVVPVYLFGNTSVLSVLKTGPLASISRRFQVS
jgi:1-acyl-sn-glycerol-3-phosphate acyltransferase